VVAKRRVFSFSRYGERVEGGSIIFAGLILFFQIVFAATHFGVFFLSADELS